MQTNNSFDYEPTTITVDQRRGCTRYTLHIKGCAEFPPAVVTAAVIPDRALNSYRVVVTAGSPQTKCINTVHELCQNDIPDLASALSWARECVRGAEQFWREATRGGDHG